MPRGSLRVDMYYDFFNIAVFLLFGVVLVFGGLLVLSLIRPDNPNDLKLSSYECGEEAFGSSWVRFDMRFYTVALIFMIFDLEIAFLFPWAAVFKDLGTIAVIEGLIFVLILFLGLIYVWAKGDLDWVKAFQTGQIVGADNPRTRLIGAHAVTSGGGDSKADDSREASSEPARDDQPEKDQPEKDQPEKDQPEKSDA